MTDPRATPPRPEILNFTGVRGFLALWVVLCHMRYLDPLKHVDFGAFLIEGYLAVDFFFVLSGFIIAYTYEPKFQRSLGHRKALLAQYRDYVLLRLGRLYPLHLASFLFFAAYVFYVLVIRGTALAEPERFTLGGAITSLAMIQAFGFSDRLSWNGVSWSVGVEMFAYVFLFVPYLLLFQRLSLRWIGVILAVLWGAVFLYALQVKGSLDIHKQAGFVRIIPEFLGGYFLYRLVQNREMLPTSPVVINALFAASLLGIVLVTLAPEAYQFLILPLILLLFFTLYCDSPLLARLFANRCTLFMGRISYAIYMTHTQAFFIGMMGFGLFAITGTPATILYFTVLLIAAGTAGHYLVEEPCRKWVRRRFVDRRSNSAPRQGVLTEQVALPRQG